MFYPRVNTLLLCLLIFTPISQACEVAIQEEGEVIWFTKTEAQPKKRFYAAVFPVGFQLTSINELTKGKVLGQDRAKKAVLPEAHSVLVVVSSPKAIERLDAYQVVTLEADGRKGFSHYGRELQTSFKEFDGGQGSRVCRWEW